MNDFKGFLDMLASANDDDFSWVEFGKNLRIMDDSLRDYQRAFHENVEMMYVMARCFKRDGKIEIIR